MLPDIAAIAVAHSGATAGLRPLTWVGMDQIETVLRVGLLSLPARADAHVSLVDPHARGIHMSRLYLALENALDTEALSPALLQLICVQFLHSHASLSDAARLRLRFDLPLKRPALASELGGWRHYPISISATHTGAGTQVEVSLRILYSSTCPCSAALARELVAEKFARDFANMRTVTSDQVQSWLKSAEGGSFATAHAQRSGLDVSFTLAPTHPTFAFVDWINRLELALQTPVQTAVKRIDEQAFAARNGANLMFVEDAIRRIDLVLATTPGLLHYQAKTAHWESLHAHDATAEIQSQR
jgi:GTP cyclohydrolase IB